MNCYFDVDLIKNILDDLMSIQNNPELTEEQKADAAADILDNCTPEQKREYMEFKRHQLYKETVNKFVGQHNLKGKYAFLEFINTQHHYTRNYAMFGMIMYLQTRLQEYKCNEYDQNVLTTFFETIFGGSSSDYIGNIYDLYYKNNKHKYPTSIPDISPEIFGKLMPSPEQMLNFSQFCDNKHEEIRSVTTALTGFKPSQEAIIRFHGIFDSEDEDVFTPTKEFIEYRDREFLSYNSFSELLPIPVGKYVLVDPFKKMRTNKVIFNPTEKDLEIINSNFIPMESSKFRQFKNRLSKIDNRADPGTIKKLSSWKQELSTLQAMPETDPNSKKTKKMELIKKKIKETKESLAKDDETISTVIKFDKSKNKTKIEDVIFS